ncbi:MAG: DUF58 domain-containing protein [Ruminococcaceae bacterium]|jgi:uncharacterized protein (DUF58 family)|nr:DUF58 domain-containing protein [Oscillospiraceae bacterium]
MAKRRLAWAAWLLAAAALWLFENNAATLSLLLASLLLPPASAAAARRGRKSVRLTLAAAESCAKGAALHAVLSAEGVGVFSRVAGRVFCENPLSGERAETAFSFSPRLSGASALTLAVDTAHCGTLRLRAEGRTEDLFGLWRSEIIPCDEEFVTVEPELFLPRVTLTESATAVADSERCSQTKPGSDPSETFAVREYVPGDPIRQIHWKLSQKSDALMLRELGLPVVNQTLLVLRNVLTADERVDAARADATAEVFLSLSHALVNEGFAHTAAFAEHGRYVLTEIQNETDFHAMKARLLTLSWEADDGALTRLLAETPYAHIAVVSAAAPPDAETLCRGDRVTVLTASPSAVTPGVYAVPFTAAGYREELSYIEL